MHIQLYHLQNSRSQRIVWLLDELGLDYQLIIHAASQGQHKYPRLILGDNQQQELNETSAITHYLCHQHKKLIICPNSIHFWTFSLYQYMSDASLMPLLVMKQVYQHTVARTPWLLRWVSFSFKYSINRFYLEPELHNQLEQINHHLAKYDYVAGEFSYADILLWFPLNACRYALKHFEHYPAITAYLDRLANRPAFQSACHKGEFDEATFKHYWSISQ